MYVVAFIAVAGIACVSVQLYHDGQAPYCLVFPREMLIFFLTVCKLVRDGSNAAEFFSKQNV